MRDPKRIDRMLEKLRAYWKRVPDFRLGQLVANLAGTKDPFHLEDDVLESRLDEWTTRPGGTGHTP